ncbi:hypothetical protein LY78DRAFT_223989 [Colletotrichum sublineola]|nr:hypothetical protein LY78DRAFT_223989 [Colletotrichum sublineola]
MARPLSLRWSHWHCRQEDLLCRVQSLHVRPKEDVPAPARGERRSMEKVFPSLTSFSKLSRPPRSWSCVQSSAEKMTLGGGRMLAWVHLTPTLTCTSFVVLASHKTRSCCPGRQMGNTSGGRTTASKSTGIPRHAAGERRRACLLETKPTAPAAGGGSQLGATRGEQYAGTPCAELPIWTLESACPISRSEAAA